jgi:hypothetical protein
VAVARYQQGAASISPASASGALATVRARRTNPRQPSPAVGSPPFRAERVRPRNPSAQHWAHPSCRPERLTTRRGAAERLAALRSGDGPASPCALGLEPLFWAWTSADHAWTVPLKCCAPSRTQRRNGALRRRPPSRASERAAMPVRPRQRSIYKTKTSHARMMYYRKMIAHELTIQACIFRRRRPQRQKPMTSVIKSYINFSIMPRAVATQTA